MDRAGAETCCPFPREAGEGEMQCRSWLYSIRPLDTAGSETGLVLPACLWPRCSRWIICDTGDLGRALSRQRVIGVECLTVSWLLALLIHLREIEKITRDSSTRAAECSSE